MATVIISSIRVKPRCTCVRFVLDVGLVYMLFTLCCKWPMVSIAVVFNNFNTSLDD